ncbi:MAG: hypothetical protein KF773_23575 [Deltaproteobacteria bacterium]|nr:hypothetical protein [Deltaproteobacteria bacterium]MCW5804002.1 hypothetical protein [Deltaproteobacteria bacterium]
MRQQPTTDDELQPRGTRRPDERPRERDKTRESRERWDRLGGDPENPAIWRGID